MFRRAGLAAVAAALFLGGGTAAYAHPQMSPAAVAPLDAVKFVLLVPGESDVPTTKVELLIPVDVLAFSFDDPPGWERTMESTDDGSTRVVWTGEMAVDGFAEFAFLAGTPEVAGEISWKALQTYADGEIVRWIGPPDSEEPASVTLVSDDAPRQNAGGESGAPVEPTTPTETTPTETAPTETETTEAEPEPTDTMAMEPTSSESGPDWFARILGLIGIAVGFAGIAFALSRRSDGPTPAPAAPTQGPPPPPTQPPAPPAPPPAPPAPPPPPPPAPPAS